MYPYLQRPRLFITLIISITLAFLLFGGYTLRLDSNLRNLFSLEESWRQYELEFNQNFPELARALVVVVDGVTAHVAENAAQKLTANLTQQQNIFTSVKLIAGEPFLVQNQLLFLPLDNLQSLLERLIQAQPLLHILSNDPSARGFFHALSLMLQGIVEKQTSPDDLRPTVQSIHDTLSAVLQNTYSPLSWQKLLTGEEPLLHGRRRIIFAKPHLNFTQLGLAQNALDAVRNTAHNLHLTPENGITIRITGDSAMENEEMQTIINTIWISVVVSVILVSILLFLGLRSWRLIGTILLTLFTGLALTISFAALAIGTVNPISIAFTILFIGMGVDFGIQFCTQYRVYKTQGMPNITAIQTTIHHIYKPLLLAAITLGACFFTFVPTAYVGIAQLGLIAGVGMFIAVLLNLTLLPALLSLCDVQPKGLARIRGLKPVDTFLSQYPITLLVLFTMLTIGAVLLVQHLRFDFNMLNLRNEKTESISTARELSQNPQTTPFSINILAPSLQDARSIIQKLETLPSVDSVVSIDTLIPTEQEEKIFLIQDTQFLLLPSLSPLTPLDPPTPLDVKNSIHETIQYLQRIPDEPLFTALQHQLTTLLQQNPQNITNILHRVLVSDLPHHLERLRLSLNPQTITFDTLPVSLRREWITPQGKVRIYVTPKGDSNNNDVLKHFVTEVRHIVPYATGTAVTIIDAAQTIINAFLLAIQIALVLSLLVLFFVLRRIPDVISVLVPLCFATLLTLATCVVVNMPLNFANIIALPLQFGIGIVFNIYFVTLWRSGTTNLLQSSTAHAILFSALTTLAAFGSLALSSHPGTASMGFLLIISLTCSLFACFFLLPVILNAFYTQNTTQSSSPPSQN